MNSDVRTRWIARLRAAACRTLGTDPALPAPDAFRDEEGNSLVIDEPFFAALAGIPSRSQPEDAAGDVALWCGSLAESVIRPSQTPAPLLADWSDVGTRWLTIEVFTERELCALHALWRQARIRSMPALADRCRFAAQWMLENLQPDNATNYPWAAHVLLELADDLGPEATLYADTLVHNCQVIRGKPDIRSAWILTECANELSYRAAEHS